MYLESIFRLQQKNRDGILLNIKEVDQNKEKFITEIQGSAAKDDFKALYIVALNRNCFEEDFVHENDFKLNAIGEIVNIMSGGDGDTRFQNYLITYLMQVKDRDFLMYVLENLLTMKGFFEKKNLQVFILTLCSNFKSPRLNRKEKEKLKNIIYQYFLEVDVELQEALLRMLEVLKIVDPYKTARIFTKVEESLRRKLMDAIKSNLSFKMILETINNLNQSEGEEEFDESNAILLIMLIDRYRLDEIIDAAARLKDKKETYNNVRDKMSELMDEKLIDESRFARLLRFR